MVRKHRDRLVFENPGMIMIGKALMVSVDFQWGMHAVTVLL